MITVIREGKTYERPVALGVCTKSRVQVVAGLEAGDIVATEGGYGLPQGCPVRIVSDAPESGAESKTHD